ncbi:polysaccharide deacetylase family protein [Natrialbaceae archaeon A-CW1-1]
MAKQSTRRDIVTGMGATAAALSLSGCLDRLTGDDGNGITDGIDGGNGNGDDGGNGQSSDDIEEYDGDFEWPAIDEGEVISDFEDLDLWAARDGTIEPAPEEARMGSQAAALESDGNQVEATLGFRDRIDLSTWDTSLAVKIESANQILLEVITTNRDHRLTSIRNVPDAYEGWLRVDFGYLHKFGEPDLENVSRLNIIARGPEDGPTRIVVDDLRRTEAVDNGKAVLAFYGGHDSQFEVAAPMLEERGWSAAVAVDPDRIGGQGRMDLEELEELQGRGWDVCAYPSSQGALPEMPLDRQEQVLERTQSALEQFGFEEGARHFVVPDDSMTQETHEAIRERYDSGLLFGAGPAGAPPTGIHMMPQIWGPALHGGVRRSINLCDQYNQLVVLRIPRIVEDESGSNSMSVDDLEHLLNHIEHRGLDVVTLSDVVDDTMEGDASEPDEDVEMEEGTIFEAGQSFEFEGSGSDSSDTFDLSDGLAVASFTHEGDGEFTVDLEAVDGSVPTEQLVVTSGGGPGASAMVVDEGSYRLSVEADGEWAIDVDQPEIHSDDLGSLPVEASGTGSSFVGPLWTDSDVSLEATHDGDGEFIIDGFNADGGWEQVINQSGSFDGSRSFSVSGAFWINVEADGEWTLEIQ